MSTAVDITDELDHVERAYEQPEIVPAIPDFSEMTLGIDPKTMHRYAQPARETSPPPPPRTSTVTVEEVIDTPAGPVEVVPLSTHTSVTVDTASTVSVSVTVVTETAPVSASAETAPAVTVNVETAPVEEDNIVQKPFTLDDLAEMRRELMRIADENKQREEQEKKEVEERRATMLKEAAAKQSKSSPKLAHAGATSDFNRYFISDEFYDYEDYTGDVTYSKSPGYSGSSKFSGKSTVVSWDEDKLDDIQSKIENIEDLATAIANEVESMSERLGDTRRRQKDMNDTMKQLDAYIRSDAFVDKIVDRLVLKLAAASHPAQ